MNAKKSALRSGNNRPNGQHSGSANAKTQTTTSSTNKKSRKGGAQINRLLASVRGQNAVFLHDRDGTPYATVDENGTRRTFAIESGPFAEWLRLRFWRDYQDVPNDHALKQCVALLSGKARYDGGERKVLLRVGHHGGNAYLDLCNGAGQVVEISPQGWTIINRAQSPIIFWQTPTMRPLPVPKRGGSLEELRPLINAEREENWVLICAFLLGQFMAEGARPVLAIQGPQGSAKSSTARKIRSVFDPDTVNTCSPPKSAEDVFVAAKNNAVLSYDNITGGVTGWLSDTICRLSTGGGMKKRALYTNYDEAAITAKRSTILNGIDELALRGDLAQRSLTVSLSTIPFRSESELDSAFTEAHGRILGGLLDGVSVALRRLPDVQTDGSWQRPRMVDFAEWVVAGEPGLPIAPGMFLKVFTEGQEHQRIDLMEGNALAEALKVLASELKLGEEYAASAEDVRSRLYDLSEERKIDVIADTFPGNGRALSQFLNRDKDDFERVTGLTISMDPHDRDPKTRRKLIRFSLKGD